MWWNHLSLGSKGVQFMKEVGEVRREKEGKVFSKKCPGLRACPHLSLPEEVMVRDSRTGPEADPEAGLEPGMNFRAAGSLLPRPAERQLLSPFPYWPASGLNLFWISNPF